MIDAMPQRGQPTKKEVYGAILGLYYHVVQSLKGQRFPPDQLEHFAGLIAKLFFHAASALMLSEGTKVSGLSFQIDFGDHASIMVLARAAVETYANFYYVFLDPVNSDQLEFRVVYSQLRGLAIRRDVQAKTPEAKLRRRNDDLLSESLYRQIQATNEFKSLKPQHQRQVLNLDHRPITKMAMIRKAGFGPKDSKILYAYLSDYAHSGYLGLLQVGQADTRDSQKAVVESGMSMIAVVMSLAINALAQKFPGTRAVLAANPHTKQLVEALCEMVAKDSLFEL